MQTDKDWICQLVVRHMISEMEFHIPSTIFSIFFN